MKAIVYTRYGPPDVLRLSDVAKPEPADREVRIRIHAANVFPGDCEMRRFQMHPSMWIPIRLFVGITRPRNPILGQELSGEVDAVGKAVTKFRAGDQIFGNTEMKMGAYAEYVCLPDTYPLSNKPPTVSYEEASTIPVGGTNALHFIRKANLQRGEKILIFGAAGSIGTYAVQLARLAGAEVTVVDTADKLEMLKSIGADKLIDYTKEDFTNNGEHYDVIFDVVGKSSYSRSLEALSPNGRYVLANVGLTVMLRGFWTSRTGNKKVLFELARSRTEDLEYLKELVQSGVLKSVIDRTYPLEQAADAHRYVESGRKAGHVVLTILANS